MMQLWVVHWFRSQNSVDKACCYVVRMQNLKSWELLIGLLHLFCALEIVAITRTHLLYSSVVQLLKSAQQPRTVATMRSSLALSSLLAVFLLCNIPSITEATFEIVIPGIITLTAAQVSSCQLLELFPTILVLLFR
jgi:hypothetical protein